MRAARALVAVVDGAGGRRELYFLPVGGAPELTALGSGAGIEDLPVGLLELDGADIVVGADRPARELYAGGEGDGLVGERLSEQLEGLAGR